MDEFLKEFSLLATTYDFGQTFRYELRIEDYQTNHLIEELKARGVGVAYGDILVRPLSLIISSKKFGDSLPESAGVNREEIFANVGEISGFSRTYLLMNMLAAALATVGLINNDIVVIISSMIVAPLLGPIVLTSLGLLSLETTKFVRKGIFAELTGIGTTITVSALISLAYNQINPLIITSENPIYSEVLNRTALTPAAISLALLGGLAAGIVVARGLDVSIVGVAIAASLCPPAATIGILLAIGQWVLAFQAANLLLLNILAIILSCTAMFWIFGVKSRGLSKRQAAKVRRLNVLWIVIVTLLIILILVTTASF